MAYGTRKFIATATSTETTDIVSRDHGVNPDYTDEEVTDKLKAEGQEIVKCLCIRNNNGATYNI